MTAPRCGWCHACAMCSRALGVEMAAQQRTIAAPMAWTVHLARALTLCAGEARRQRTSIEVARRGMLGRTRRSEKRIARAKVGAL